MFVSIDNISYSYCNEFVVIIGFQVIGCYLII